MRSKDGDEAGRGSSMRYHSVGQCSGEETAGGFRSAARVAFSCHLPPPAVLPLLLPPEPLGVNGAASPRNSFTQTWEPGKGQGQPTGPEARETPCASPSATEPGRARRASEARPAEVPRGTTEGAGADVSRWPWVLHRFLPGGSGCRSHWGRAGCGTGSEGGSEPVSTCTSASQHI